MRLSFFIKPKFAWILPTIIFSILIVMGALAHPLWGDEAETALFARSILTHGVPYGWDGTYLMGNDNAVSLNSDLVNHSNPWLQYYLSAASFKLFGEGAFQARLPFLIIGMAGVPILYFLTLKLTKNKFVSFLTILKFSLSTTFILYAINARYYNTNIFFGLLFLFATFYLNEKKLWPKVLLIFSTIGYTYSHYISFPTFFGALFLGYIVYFWAVGEKWKNIKSFFIKYFSLSFLGYLFFLPWILVMSPLHGRGTIDIFDYLGALQAIPDIMFFGYNFFSRNNALPLGILILFLGVAILGYRRYSKSFELKQFAPLFLIFVTTFFYLLANAVSTIAMQSDNPTLAPRYNTILLPLFTIISAYVLFVIYKLNKWIFVVIAALFIFTNTFTLSGFQIRLWDYLNEVTNPYKTSDQYVADVLNKNAHDGDTAFLSLDRSHESLEFLLHKKIKFINRISPINSVLFPKNYKTLPSYLYGFLGSPDWVVLYSKRHSGMNYYNVDIRDGYPMGLSPGVDLERDYTLTILPVYYLSDIQRPEIEFHQFYKVIPMYNDQVFLYHKKNAP
ncbi:MAG TPA: glycosyltransferase family 39 protein [Patescibacteria group bacterium]|nr:glycosyltransferase family 39 protein [Patescibacteria group bacterium]